MNVNKLSEQLLEVYRKLDVWPQGVFPERLCKLNALSASAYESFEASRQYGLQLIHDTCAVSKEDCPYWESCTMEGKETGTACEPEGLAFRLADIVMQTLAMMAELGIDIDAVVMAEYRYLAAKAGEE